VKEQALIEFRIGEDKFESVFLITPQLTSGAIIGCQFLKEYEIAINFARSKFSYVRDGIVKECSFSQRRRTQTCSDRNSKGKVPDHKPTPPPDQQPHTAELNLSIPLQSGRLGSEYLKCFEAANQGAGYDLQQDEGFIDPCVCTTGAACDPINEVESFSQVELLPDLSESRGPDVLPKVAEISNYIRRILPELEIPSIPTRTEPHPPDPRALQRSDLSNLVAMNENLNPGQRDQLYGVLENYLDSFTEKPGKCNLFEYRFQVESNQPFATYSRPIPFAMRPAVRTIRAVNTRRHSENQRFALFKSFI
jgi:hypothetical protein